MTEYSITQVAKILEVPQHVLRMWESQFASIQPVRGRNGRRAYNADTIAAIREVQVMLHEQGLTMAQAREKLGNAPVQPPTSTPQQARGGAQNREQLEKILAALNTASAALARG